MEFHFEADYLIHVTSSEPFVATCYQIRNRTLALYISASDSTLAAAHKEELCYVVEIKSISKRREFILYYRHLGNSNRFNLPLYFLSLFSAQ
jgi:hypothetical protein